MQQAHFERPTTHKPDTVMVRRILYLVLVALTGLMAGALGFALLLRLYLPSSDVGLSSEYGLALRRSISVQIEQPVVEQGKAVSPSIATIVRHAASRPTVLEALVSPAEVVNTAAIVTSDGWVVSRLSGPAASYDVLIDGVYYQGQRLVQDSFTGLSFLKVDAQGLTPVSFTDNLPEAGSFAFSARQDHGNTLSVKPHYIRQSRWNPGSSRTDMVKTGTAVADFIGMEQAAEGVVFNGRGELLGMTDDTYHDALIPARHIKISLENVLRGTTDTDFGVFYVDTYVTRSTQMQGATVFHPTRNPIRPGTPAAQAKLAKFDTILAINGTTLSAGLPLEYLWRKVQHEDTIRLLIRRNEKELTIEL